MTSKWNPEAREFVKSIYQYLDEEGNVDPAQRAKFQELIAEEDAKLEVRVIFSLSSSSLNINVLGRRKKETGSIQSWERTLEKGKGDNSSDSYF